AVYNVEKYLDDFFKSIINQKLDFKSNIHLICVDDGSTDNSANIIKKYQKKYPKNIIYLYKENGGQASARNLGLKYLKENDLNILWVTFTDPDDFLDRDYFYEVDSFLKKQN
ncbi:glycosyltransferase family A protein, partial [Campylobacter jejuni]